jgi:hypothetical protein
VADQACDVFQVDVMSAQADEGVPKISGRPLLAETRLFDNRPEERRTLYASNGVPTADVKTRPWSCHSSPALNWAAACRLPWSLSASNALKGNFRTRLLFSVLVSPDARTLR